MSTRTVVGAGALPVPVYRLVTGTPERLNLPLHRTRRDAPPGQFPGSPPRRSASSATSRGIKCRPGTGNGAGRHPHQVNSVGVVVNVRDVLLVSMRMRMGLRVVDVFVLMVNMFVIVQHVGVGMGYVPVRVLRRHLLLRSRSTPFETPTPYVKGIGPLINDATRRPADGKFVN